MTTQRIKEAALKFFSEKGYDATTLADIAGEIGIKKPSLYAHFPGKLEIYHAVLEDVRKDYRNCWLEALGRSEGMGVTERLEFLFVYVSEYFFVEREKMMFMIRQWMFPPEECKGEILQILQNMNEEFICAVADIIQAGIDQGILRPGVAEEIAHAYFSILDGYLVRWAYYRRFDYRKALPSVREIFFRGVLR